LLGANASKGKINERVQNLPGGALFLSAAEKARSPVLTPPGSTGDAVRCGEGGWPWFVGRRRREVAGPAGDRRILTAC
jgi:hypothetical protein